MSIVNTVVYDVFARFGFHAYITVGSDGQHGKFTLHHIGYALDYRSKHIPSADTKNKILIELRAALPCCDVLLEDIGGANEHFHIEYDPKYDLAFQAAKANYFKTGVWSWAS